MIYTSYFANLRHVTSNIVPIAICQYPPQYWKGLVYKDLAPSPQLFKIAKSGDWNSFEVGYTQQISKLDIDDVVEQLFEMADSEDIVLTCFEKSGDNCHRHILADILRLNGYEVSEYGV